MSEGVEPYDEEKITGDAIIIRRINPAEHVVLDHNRNCRRLSSKTFQPSSEEMGGMSIDVEALITAAGKDPKVYVQTPPFLGAVSFTAGEIRAIGLIVGYDPLEINPYHGEVWGVGRPNRFTDGQKKSLRKVAQWYVRIDGVEIE